MARASKASHTHDASRAFTFSLSDRFCKYAAIREQWNFILVARLYQALKHFKCQQVLLVHSPLNFEFIFLLSCLYIHIYPFSRLFNSYFQYMEKCLKKNSFWIWMKLLDRPNEIDHRLIKWAFLLSSVLFYESDLSTIVSYACGCQKTWFKRLLSKSLIWAFFLDMIKISLAQQIVETIYFLWQKDLPPPGTWTVQEHNRIPRAEDKLGLWKYRFLKLGENHLRPVMARQNFIGPN